MSILFFVTIPTPYFLSPGILTLQARVLMKEWLKGLPG
jgi:hypothetical protein